MDGNGLPIYVVVVLVLEDGVWRERREASPAQLRMVVGNG